MTPLENQLFNLLSTIQQTMELQQQQFRQDMLKITAQYQQERKVLLEKMVLTHQLLIQDREALQTLLQNFNVELKTNENSKTSLLKTLIARLLDVEKSQKETDASLSSLIQLLQELQITS